jgi:hypothetical protein
VLYDHAFDFGQFSSVKTMVRSNLDRIKPILRFIPRCPNVDVSRLVAFIAEEEKAIPANSQDYRHFDMAFSPKLFYRPNGLNHDGWFGRLG